MATAGRYDWYRSLAWDAQIEARFEERLRRARPESRPQYIRIQATYLLESPDPGIREAGRGLLQRVIAEYPADLQARTAMEQLGGSLADDGRLGEAEQAFRETIRMCADSPIGRSGTTGTAELRLAEVILASGDAARIPEAAGLLDAAEPQIMQLRSLRNVVFRHLLASARVAWLRHDPAAWQLARDALAVAAETTPSFPRHPDVGRPSASEDEVAELEEIASGHLQSEYGHFCHLARNRARQINLICAPQSPSAERLTAGQNGGSRTRLQPANVTQRGGYSRVRVTSLPTRRLCEPSVKAGRGPMVLILRALPGENRVMAGGELEAAAAAAWAEALGCDLRLLGEPGAHMVPGGARLRGRNVVYMAEVRAAVLVYCPGRLRPRAAAVLASTPPGHLFTPGACARIAGVGEAQILGPSWHGFTDAGYFTPAVPGAGRRLDRGDPLLAGLREACGEAEWAEGGFADPDGVMYGIEEDGSLAAAGNLTRFRGYPADVGLLTHPATRGRGLAKKIAVQMIGDALPAAGIIRYRALATNSPSLAIARSLGFAGYGQNLIARLPA